MKTHIASPSGDNHLYGKSESSPVKRATMSVFPHYNGEKIRRTYEVSGAPVKHDVQGLFGTSYSWRVLDFDLFILKFLC